MQKFYKLKLFQIAILLLTLTAVPAVVAHSPHDQIFLLEMSPAYAFDSTVFTSIQPVGDHFGRLLKSTNGGGSWIELGNGLDNKSYLTSIAISPAFRVDQTMFIGTSGDGVFKSLDGGVSWTNVDVTLGVKNISLLKISPDYQADQVIVAAGGNGGLIRSGDGGRKWSEIMNGEKKITSIAFNRSQGGMNLLAGDSDGNVFVSINGGLNWKSKGNPLSSAITAISCFNSLHSHSKCLVGTQKDGIFEYGENGAPITARNAGLKMTGSSDFKSITSIAILPDSKTHSKVFVTTWSKAVFVSNDKGETWQLYDSGITTTKQADSYHSPHFSRLVASRSRKTNATLFLAGYDGLFKSEDLGKTWRQVETLVTKRVEAVSISPDYSSSKTIAVATQYGGAYLSDDGGQTWAVINQGLKEVHLWDIAFSPAYAKDNTFIAISNGAFYKLAADDRTWDRFALRENKWILRMQRLLGKKLSSKHFPLYIVMSPNFKNDQILYFGTRNKGVFLSEDRGSTWSNVWDAEGGWVSSLVISPSFPNDGTLYAAIVINGKSSAVYKTTDRGSNWQRIGDSVNAVLAKNPDAKAKLAISPDYDADKTVFVGTVDGLFQSNDAGKSWRKPIRLNAVKNGYVRAIAISPNYREDGNVLVSIKGRGLFKSADRGKHFFHIGSQTLSKDYQFQSLVFSPDYKIDETIYGAAQGELLQSSDAGNSWFILPRPLRYEDKNPAIQYEGQWKRVRDENSSATTVTVSNHPQDRATLYFFGTGITLRAKLSGGQDSITIYLDGERKEVEGFSKVADGIVNAFSISGLVLKPHTITVELNGSKNEYEADQRIEIDYFDILP